MQQVIGLLDRLPLWAVFAATALLLIAFHELGYRFAQGSKAPANVAQIGAVMPAVLTLLSLLLAFTFGMANARFDARRQAVLDDVNGISTAWLRSRLLASADAEAIRSLLTRYVELRLEAARSTTFAELEHAMVESKELHEQMWRRALAAFREDPRSNTASLFVQSLNEVIDLDERRVSFGVRYRIAASVWLTLYFLAFAAIALVGAHARLAGELGGRRVAVLFVLMLSATLTVTIDLDRPRQTLFQVSQEPLLELKQDFTRSSAEATGGD